MKRVGLLVACVGLLALPVFAEETEPAPQQQQVVRPNARNLQQNQGQQQQPDSQAQPRNEVQERIAALYVAGFIKGVKLTDEQFLKIGNFIQRYIQMRFNMATRRERINRVLDQLSSQPNPSEEDVAALMAEKSIVDTNIGNAENKFLELIKGSLTRRQIPLFYAYNLEFFDKRLPNLIDLARATAAQRGQAQQPQNRANANPAKNRNNTQAPVDAFQGGRKK